ncbi:MAG: single-stranded-DNA-specific exonuclease RecJ [Anaerolineae bacterium]|nr:single-stranded-DNA-specific exonuclease RecJ [Anaerolineae bacterium]
MIIKQWEFAPAAPKSLLKKYQKVSPILAQLLYNRGLQTPDEAYHFLYDKDLSINPFAMKDMEKAVARIRRAIKQNEAIVVYGDFDADGVTATALMMQVLKRLNANVRAYIPHRVDEGYGLNTPALEELASQGMKVVITVDCGIRSVQEVEDGNAAGLDIIITDHHSTGPEIPPALAVVNPQQEDCSGDKSLAGVGVAFMVARGLLLDAWEKNGKQKAHQRIYAQLVNELLDLVAIGTVADIMPLNSATNRALVRQGLGVINRAHRLGLRALMDVAGVKLGQATAMSIGFGLAPRINAAGRLESALTAYEMLSAADVEEARRYAEELNSLNQERQRLTAEAQDRVRQMLDANDMSNAQLIFAVDDEVSPGIVGLVAGRLTEEFFRPAVVVERGDEECHASCRSIPQFHITQALDECADLLVRHGGHAMAAGLTVLPENLDLLQERLQEKARAVLDGLELLPTLHIDMEVSMRDLTMALARELDVLEPTGQANKKPVFMTSNLRVDDVKTVGNGAAHLKVKLSADGQPPIDAIGFRLGDWAYDMPPVIDAAYHLEVNEWQGRRNLQLNLQDIRPSQ